MSAVNQHVIDMQTVHAWCLDMSHTIKHSNFNRHQELVSEKLRIYGMPSKEVITYKEWYKRRKFEMRNGMLMSVNYQDVKLTSSTSRRLRFSGYEVMLGNDGKMVILDKSFILELEGDNVWRLVEEKVNSWRVQQLNLENY